MGEEDVRNAAERLRKLLRAAQYPQLSALRLEAGDVADLLRVLHFVLLDSSRAVAQFLVDKGYDLYGKTDARFVESAFRLLRNEFRYFPSLSVTQFLSKHFVARRLAIVADAAAAVAQKRQELQRLKRREEAVWSQPKERNINIKPSVENHVLPTAVTNHAASILQHLKVQSKATGQTRRVRRASSETPMQISGAGQDRETMAAPPAPVFTGRQVDAHTAVQFASEKVCEEAFVVDDTRPSSPQPKPCSCSQDSEKLATAIAGLSRQLSEMTSALMGKITSVEARLGRLEDQMHGVQAAVEEQRKVVWEMNTTGSRRMVSDTATRSDDERPMTKSKTLDIEAPCAWPPQPSVFERY